MDLIDFNGLPYPGMSPDLRVLTILAKYAAFGIVPEVVPVPTPDISVPVQQIPVQQRHRPGLRPAPGQGGRLRLLHHARAAAGNEPGVLGTAGQDRASRSRRST